LEAPLATIRRAVAGEDGPITLARMLGPCAEIGLASGEDGPAAGVRRDVASNRRHLRTGRLADLGRGLLEDVGGAGADGQLHALGREMPGRAASETPRSGRDGGPPAPSSGIPPVANEYPLLPFYHAGNSLSKLSVRRLMAKLPPPMTTPRSNHRPCNRSTRCHPIWKAPRLAHCPLTSTCSRKPESPSPSR